jgi:hypothetical protein
MAKNMAGKPGRKWPGIPAFSVSKYGISDGIKFRNR